MNEEKKIIFKAKRIGGQNLAQIKRIILFNLNDKYRNSIKLSLQKNLSETVTAFNAEAKTKADELSNKKQADFVNFRQQVDILLAHEQEIKPFEKGLNDKLKQLPQNVNTTFIYTINLLVQERRLFRRYLKSRFGIKNIEKGNFSHLSNPLDRILFSSAIESFLHCDMQFLMWLFAIKEVSTAPVVFSNFETLVSSIFICVRPGLADFRLFLMDTRISMHKNDDLEIDETDLASLTAWAEANISFSPQHNPRLAKTVEKEGVKAVKDNIPTSVLIALDEKEPHEPYSSGSGGKSVISRISNLLEDKSLHHQEIGLDQISQEGNLAIFSARAEAKIDLARLISSAAITDRAKTILYFHDVDEMSFETIAKELGVKKSTVSTTYYRAIEKLIQTQSEK